MTVLADIVALLIAALGWYYLFYSRAAHKLGGLESERINARRVRLRRFGGGLVTLLGVLFFAGSQDIPPVWFIVTWGSVMLLLAVLCIMALIDLRLTWDLRKHRGQGPPP